MRTVGPSGPSTWVNAMSRSNLADGARASSSVVPFSRPSVAAPTWSFCQLVMT